MKTHKLLGVWINKLDGINDKELLIFSSLLYLWQQEMMETKENDMMLLQEKIQSLTGNNWIDSSNMFQILKTN